MVEIKQNGWKWLPIAYVCCMAIVMLGYVQFDSYQIDGDAVSYMDLASAMLHGRWHEIANGLWNPGYPALLALGKLITHAGRMHELQAFYWVNYCIFLGSLACTWFFVRSILIVRATVSMTETSEAGLFPAPLLYLVSYATVFCSWLNEFSLGKIRVDGLFASLLLLAFAFLLRAFFRPRLVFDLGLGVSLGMAYLVKSPGFIIAVVSFILLAIYGIAASPARYPRRRLLVSIAMFILVAGPYITALSIQKGRADFGDSGKLNYAWYVSGTEAQHLLNNQRARFGNATVHLKHSEMELLSDPVVLYFSHFLNATYGPWFDPSYFNEGVQPHVTLGKQIHLSLRQSRHIVLFIVIHSLLIAFLVFCFTCGAEIERASSVRGMLLLIYFVLLFSFAMYLGVHFLDRYVAGQFWIAMIATFGLLVSSDAKRRYVVQGAGIFLAIAILLLGVQGVVRLRQAAILQGIGNGWNSPAEFEAASALRAHGIIPGESVACFRACNNGAYWARLAGVHVTSEIYDPATMSDGATGSMMWQRLPNKAAALDALRSTGAKALVGYFEEPPASDEGWLHLAGGYYFISLSGSRDPGD